MLSRGLVIAIALGCSAVALAHGHEHSHSDEYADDDAASEVTCGSVIKLQHAESSFMLHSHDIKWGSGSEQQSVTATPESGDPNSYWIVNEALGAPACKRGQPIKCGQVVRLEHLATARNLHSHLFRSPLSGQQEVSAFGEEGQGDSGDNWKVMCLRSTGVKTWRRNTRVRLVHTDTGGYLHSHASHRFNARNCGHNWCARARARARAPARSRAVHSPIGGQQEVTVFSNKDRNNLWLADLGLYMSE